MSRLDVRDEFLVRYYRWALEDARREVAEGLRLMRCVNGAVAARAVEHIESLQVEQQLALFAAQIKRVQSRAMDLVGDRLHAEEEALLRLRDAAVFQVDANRIAPKPGRSKLLTAVRREMADIGTPGKPAGQMEAFTTAVDAWTIHTVVSCGSPPYYCHHVRGGGGRALTSLQEWASVLSWLGVAGQSTWDLARGGDEIGIARAIATVSRHFLAAAPALLGDLRVPAT